MGKYVVESKSALETYIKLTQSHVGYLKAGWYDVRVRICKAEAGEPEETSPQFAPLPAAPGTGKVRKLWQAFVAGNGDFK